MSNTIRVVDADTNHWAAYPTGRVVKFFKRVLRRDNGNTLLRLLRIAARKNYLKSLICIMDQDVFESDISLSEFDEFWITHVRVGDKTPESFNDTVRLLIEEQKGNP